jgi:translation elongation factor P/translation initiation factor 5A
MSTVKDKPIAKIAKTKTASKAKAAASKIAVSARDMPNEAKLGSAKLSAEQRERIQVDRLLKRLIEKNKDILDRLAAL